MSRQAVQEAQNEARRRGHNEVDTWHLLAALLAQGKRHRPFPGREARPDRQRPPTRGRSRTRASAEGVGCRRCFQNLRHPGPQ
ncbi:MAG: Clp protease N-terminal domain-containing protein [Lacunisphaera sp.]